MILPIRRIPRYWNRLGEFSYEESFIDEVSENNPDNYVTQITVPFQFE